MKSHTEARIERVARALCKAAATDLQPQCPMCRERGGICTMWPQFQREAAIAIRAMKGK